MATVKTGSIDTAAIQSEKGIIIQNITIRPVQRSTQDIGKWRRALQSAEGYYGLRKELYDLYEDLLLDGHLISVSRKRVNGVTKRRLTFLDAAGKEVPAMKKLAATKAFRKLRKEMQKHKLYGIAVIELNRDGEKLKVIPAPPKHIRPREGLILNEELGNTGILYREAPASNYVLEVGDREDLGLLKSAAQYVIYKRGGFGDWAEFAQIFGMPFRKGTYSGYDEASRIQLEKALEQAGSAAYAVIPEGANIEFLENKSTGSSQLYKDLKDACNQELSVLFLGETETTVSSKSSGYAQSETHMQVSQELADDDAADEIAILNEDVVPILANLGFPVEGGSFAYEQVETIPLKERVDMDIKIANRQPVDDDYFYGKYGIPKPDDYEKKKAEMDAQKEAALQSKQQPAPAVKPGKKKKLAGDDFWSGFFQNASSFFSIAPEE